MSDGYTYTIKQIQSDLSDRLATLQKRVVRKVADIMDADDLHVAVEHEKVGDDEIDQLIRRIKKHSTPTNWKRFFLMQSAQDIKIVEETREELKAVLRAKLTQRIITDDKLAIALRAALRDCAEQMKKRTPPPKAKPQLTVVKPQPVVEHHRSTVITETDSSVDLVNTVLLYNVLTSSTESHQAPMPEIISGNGGDFGGGGATGSWEEPVCQQPEQNSDQPSLECTRDDLGASRFS